MGYRSVPNPANLGDTVISEKFATTANYVDSTFDPDRELDISCMISGECQIQTKRINQKDNSRAWDITDNILGACDIAFSRIAGIRFRTPPGGQSATIYVIGTFERDDVIVKRVSSNV